jgi:hypothetical protein
MRGRVDGPVLEIGAQLGPGLDVAPGLKCRLYRTEDGFAGAPLDDWVLEALRQPTGS